MSEDEKLSIDHGSGHATTVNRKLPFIAIMSEDEKLSEDPLGAIKERAKSIQFDFAGNKRGESGHATNEGAEKKERRFAFAGNHIHMKTMGLVMPQQSIANCHFCLMPIYAYSLGAATRTWFTYTVVRKHNFDQGAIKERAKSIQFDFAGNKRGESGHATNEVGIQFAFASHPQITYLCI
ncbi:hypothetical protein E3N88_44429 [Mikania micrantha]|uniref:Uncharacterized protein n=1 Tax=Mikania micrantha TaxID=192012 RepID=A0A5N6LCC4_9ASTR|nr:hypothetical protein E3N88_44429 [Mikania micrantha]